MSNPKKLSKEQVERIKHKARIYRHDTYSEQQLREAVEMETDFSPISWGEICDYVFFWCKDIIGCFPFPLSVLSVVLLFEPALWL